MTFESYNNVYYFNAFYNRIIVLSLQLERSYDFWARVILNSLKGRKGLEEKTN
jgi:hypothetical protein